MSALPKPYLTPEEYLEIERNAEHKHEYFDGEMFAMAGGSPEHSQVIANVIIELGYQLKKRPCVVYSSDVRVNVAPTGLYTYPDVTVVCGSPQFSDDQKDTLINPLLIVEVLSDSTEAYDRGRKFDMYRTLPSLREYLLVSQLEPRLALYTRQPDDRWLLSDAIGREAALHLESVDCVLALADVYLKVTTGVPGAARPREGE